MRPHILLFLLIGLGVAATVHAARYVAPPSGRLVLNAVLPPEVTMGSALPLYLDKTGRYYAELYVEGADAKPAAVSSATPLSFRFVFTRRDRVLHEEQVDVLLAPGTHHETLFWLEAPGQLPARQELGLVVSLRELPPALVGKALRLQLTRKFEMRPIAPP